MVTEIAILEATPGQEDAFREGLKQARKVVEQAEGYRGSRFLQGMEKPGQFVLLIEWDSVEAHNEGFRKSERFAEWRKPFGHLLAGTPTVYHYETFTE